jgi:hypothetical protein
MLSIIVLIIKIIGIILLSIIGLILFLLALVLLVPIRYRVYVEHGEAFHLEGTVSWLLHFIHAGFSGDEMKPQLRIRILGFVIYDNKRIKTQRPMKKKKRARFSKNGKKAMRLSPERKPSIKITDKEKHIQDIQDRIPLEEVNKEIIFHDTQQENLQEISENVTKGSIANERLQEEKAQSRKMQPELIDNISTQKLKLDIKVERSSLINKILHKYHQIKDGIKNFFKKIWEKLKAIVTTLCDIRKKYYLITDFLKNELNKDAFRFIFEKLKGLLKHILPTKLRSSIIFGTGDPCSTGQILGVLGIFYGIYGDKVKITPDFENQRFEGKHKARGRIRLATILIIVIKIVLDKRFQQLKSNFKILKEAL